jgi:hypothetical protein
MEKMSKKSKECANFILKETEKIVKRETGKKLPKGVRRSPNFCPLAQVFKTSVSDGSDVPLKKIPKVKNIVIPGLEKTPCNDVNNAMTWEFMSTREIVDSANTAIISKEETILTEFTKHFDKGNYPHLAREATQKEIDKDESY